MKLDTAEKDITSIAKVYHEANRAYCETIGDKSQKAWDDTDQWQRDSAISGVVFAIENPDAPASAQHDAWLSHKRNDGWIYGPEKDPVKKTHPCIVPYNELPIEQRRKDALFKAIVAAIY